MSEKEVKKIMETLAWVELIKEARDLGLTKEQVSKDLKEMSGDK